MPRRPSEAEETASSADGDRIAIFSTLATMDGERAFERREDESTKQWFVKRRQDLGVFKPAPDLI
jgi:hypothetical protein